MLLKDTVNNLLFSTYTSLNKSTIKLNSAVSNMLRFIFSLFNCTQDQLATVILLSSAYIFIILMAKTVESGYVANYFIDVLKVIGLILGYTFISFIKHIFDKDIDKLLQSGEAYKKNEAQRLKNLKNLTANIYLNDFIQNSGLFHDKEVSRYSQDILKAIEGNEVYKPTGLFSKDGRFETYFFGVANNKELYEEYIKNFDLSNKKGIIERDLKKAFEYNKYYQKDFTKILNTLKFNIEVRDDEFEDAFEIATLAHKIKGTIDRDVSALETKKKEFYKEHGTGVLSDKIKVRI